MRIIGHGSRLVGSCLITAAVIGPGAGAAGAQESGAASEIVRLRAELDQLRARLPDQSHVMKDVGYHFTNLWFAAQTQN